MEREDTLTTTAETDAPERRRGEDRRRRQSTIFVDRRLGDRRSTPGLDALVRMLFGRARKN